MKNTNVFLRFIREHGLSQTKLAKMAGVKQPSVFDWIHGRSRPSIKAAVRLVKAGGPSLHEIYPELYALSADFTAKKPDNEPENDNANVDN